LTHRPLQQSYSLRPKRTLAQPNQYPIVSGPASDDAQNGLTDDKDNLHETIKSNLCKACKNTPILRRNHIFASERSNKGSIHLVKVYLDGVPLEVEFQSAKDSDCKPLPATAELLFCTSEAD
jgi:hypothetical protein